MGEILLPHSGGSGVHPPKRNELRKTKFYKLKKRLNKGLPPMEGPACGGIRQDSGEGVAFGSFSILEKRISGAAA